MPDTDKRKLAEVTDTIEDDDSDGIVSPIRKKGKVNVEAGPQGLFLDTVNRYMLDFDFEKLCSVSLSNLNVYACLVCGNYFQGRGKSSHAYFHSLHENHHVFINLHTLKVYILPDGYEVTDASLNDIKYVLNPIFTREQVSQLNKTNPYAYDLNNKRYLPGFVGLNNIKANDYVNVVVQSLIHVQPLRNHFLLDTSESGLELVKRFGMLVRKIWNPRAFKGQVSPHEFLQEISNASQKRFRLSQQSDPIDLLTWLLNTMHAGMGGKKKAGSSLIHQTFQGEVQVDSQTILVREAGNGEDAARKLFDTSREITTKRTPFMFLALDVPPPPLFQDEVEKNIIPQIPLTTLLSKYDGVTGQENGNVLRRYKITKLPQYLVFHIKRFTKNNWNMEKNPTIVNFPIKNLDMSEFIEGPDALGETRFDLVANICHEGRPGAGNGTYRVHVHDRAKDQWFQIQDLFVEEIMPQMIFLSESYIQIWERKLNET
ncbi:hypothetical protein PhCBS80983_g00107 [Powellomyces hirtus]|uniref:USP domain-containing protein n=1 Tax=Powellomyces hirtus TaxID=109895 RepID=A0A507EHH9_9FUNG|nr:hypothetical protein DFJ77DRAFT_509661 [Powellomyces hirtus]TPX62855.1 hypothetical protein PhCBS80983_g00107 [Powellomyces hirtus]